jgi:3-phenylpropionate/cinnamic acid dioxygenase small subunit
MITTTANQVPVELYASLKDFYARHIKKRDAGFTDQWLADFDEKATLSTNIFDVPVQEGREAIGVNVHALDNWFARQGIQRRHLLGTFVATRSGSDDIRTRCYALLLTTKPPGGTTVHSTSVASDLLRYRCGVWRVLSRHIERDDLAQGSRNFERNNRSLRGHD